MTVAIPILTSHFFNNRRSAVKLFECQCCGNILYFENRICGRCGRRTGFWPRTGNLVALEPHGQVWRTICAAAPSLRFCANAEFDVCNWLLESGSGDYCRTCRHNGTIPDLSDP